MNTTDLFKAIASKRLSPVDADFNKSHQHEIGGLSELRKIWGEIEHNKKFSCTFIYISDNDHIRDEGIITWYDSRHNVTHRGPEWRIYYKDNDVTEMMNPFDLLVIAVKQDGSVFFIVGDKNSGAENQIRELFKISEIKPTGFTVIDPSQKNIEIDYTSRFILDSIGIEIDYSDDNYLEQLLDKFQDGFPKTRVFSEFARKSLIYSEFESRDELLVAWMDREELLFNTLEKHFVEKKIRKGFDEVEDFLSFSLSVQNRRKSRAGHAFENHIEEIFIKEKLFYVRGKVTEKKKKPDFLFPSSDAYQSFNTPNKSLTMLGAKTSCKDRWRQVLTEANRIPYKHLITLEPGISRDQLSEMEDSKLQLVIPQPVINSYSDESQKQLINFGQFLDLIKLKQSQI